ncbi:MAG TPA: redoxin domain-containing protein [Bryobacteraceae bacterium]|jgi:thiol-disulfide isomerase/thioredoxin
MRNKSLVKSILCDLLTGVAAIGVVFLAAVGTSIFSDMRQVFLIMALLFVAVGFARGRSSPIAKWLQTLLLVSPCLLVFGFSTPPAMFGLIVVVSCVAAVIGVSARRNWAVHRIGSVVSIAALLATVAVGSIVGAPMLANRLNNRTTDKVIPEFSVTELDGTVLRSSELRGRVVVIDFWATWCPPCRQEFPELEKVYRRYRTNPNVKFLAIDVNREGETPEKARAFIKKAEYTIPIAYDSNEVVTRLKAQGYPHLLVLDRTGHLRIEHVGYDGAEHLIENLSKEIDKLLSERS